MANGDAQFYAIQLVDDEGHPIAGWQLYHYAAGTMNTLDVWQDAGRTVAMPNPILADARGRIAFYADGTYRLMLAAADGNLLYFHDNVRITADQATEWEGNIGTSLPPANTKNRGQLFALLDGQGAIDSLQINDTGLAFAPVPLTLRSSTKVALPTPSPTSPGRVRRLSDSTRGLWMDTGQQWFALNGQVANVKEFGAKGNGTDNDDGAFQFALNALAVSGGGVLEVPPGQYLITQLFIPSSVWIRGAGASATVLLNSSTQGSQGMIRNTNTVSGNGSIRISDLTMARTVQAPGSLNNECIYLEKCEYIWIENCIFIGSASAHSSSNRAITLQNCSRLWVRNNAFVNWPEYDVFLGNNTGAPLHGFATIEGNLFALTWNGSHGAIGVQTDHVQVRGNIMQSSTQGRLSFLVSCGAQVTDLLVAGNLCFNARIAILTAGGRVTIRDNQATFSAIEVTNLFGTVYDLLIANNEIEYGRISVEGDANATGGFDLTGVTVKGNKVTRSSVATEYGILVRNAKKARISSNEVNESQGGGIGVIDVRDFVLSENWSFENGQGGSGALGMRDGYFISCASAWVGHGRVTNNHAKSNAGYAFHFATPQGIDFVDCASSGDVSGFLQVDNPTGIGPLPFGLVRYVDMTSASFNPENAIYASPGSTIMRGISPGANRVPGFMKTLGSGNTGWWAIGSSLTTL